MIAPPINGATERRDPGFFRRIWAMIVKEFVQMRRDRLTFATMIFVPILQLTLFGYAINTDPKQLPTAVLTRDDGPLTRAVLAAMQNTDYFDFRWQVRDRRGARPADQVGRGAIRRRDPGELRARRAARRPARGAGRSPTPPIRWRPAPRSPRCQGLIDTALRRELRGPDAAVDASRGAVRAHAAAPLQPGRHHPIQHRARPARRDPDHDHDDDHRARGDARDRARHDGEPARHADQAGRDHDRQDRALRPGRLRADDDHPRRGAFPVRRADRGQRVAAWWRCRRCSSPPISRSAIRSRPSPAISCRRCR